VSRRVWRDGDVFRKTVTDVGAARLLAERTRTLRAAGVSTPEARLAAGSATLSFPSIEGESGLALIAAQGAGCLPRLLEPLRALHLAAIAGLAPFDPAAKILNRLRPGDPERRLHDLLVRVSEHGGTARTGTVHGDFHAGQLVVDAAGQAWLLDLEDLAVGAPEADLGNFAAHLATRPETRRGAAATGFETWLADTIGAYAAIGTAADPLLARLHGQLALIRRALKLREAGDPELAAELAQDGLY